ncbi:MULTISPECIES: ABC transporter permease [Methylobacillus]|nr:MULTISPECIES: ABC transporter permease [Methylobacillus]
MKKYLSSTTNTGKPSAQQARKRLWAVRGGPGNHEFLVRCLGFMIPLAIWWAASLSGLIPETFLPDPPKVLKRLLLWISDEGFGQDFWISFVRVSSGFLLAAVLALPIGVLAGTFRRVQIFIEPLMDFIRYMPAVAFVPLVLLWCGVGEASKIALIFIGTFFQMVLMMAGNVRQVPMAQIEAAQTMGATRRELLFKVILPSAAPALLDTIRVTLGWAWTYLVVAELVAANEGLGYAILRAQRFLLTDKIFAGILVIGLIGLIQDQLLRAIYRKRFPYAQSN